MSGLNQNAAGALAGIPEVLRAPLIEEYNKVVRNYREGRWEPAELSGGKLCEIAYCILKGHLDGNFPPAPFKPKNMVDACRGLEQASGVRSVKIQIPRMLIALYEIRNNRNVGHVGADVDPSHMDATLVLSMVDWIMAELVRIFHNVDVAEATKLVAALVDRSVPLVWQSNSGPRVLGTHLSAKQKTMVFLYSSSGPVAIPDILAAIGYTNGSRFRRDVLKPAHRDDLLHFVERADAAEITPVGAKFVEDNIALTL